ncbi:MAG: hypothetical protein HRF48_13445 [Chloroflexota bacterium]|jgi:hypothetical protein
MKRITTMLLVIMLLTAGVSLRAQEPGERVLYQQNFGGDPPAQGKRHPPVKRAAGDFAPRLAALHRALDEAVCDAYGWEHDVLADEEEILRRLLALNLERASLVENG